MKGTTPVPASPAEAEVGVTYAVPHIRLSETVRIADSTHQAIGYETEYVPVLGPIHEDSDVIGFQPYHIHLDYRFVEFVNSIYINDRWLTPNELEKEVKRMMALVVLVQHPQNVEIKLLGRKCQRLAERFPECGFAYRLERKFADQKVVGGLCPHKKLLLAAGQVQPNGSTVCAGHGLCWRPDGSLERTKHLTSQHQPFWP